MQLVFLDAAIGVLLLAAIVAAGIRKQRPRAGWARASGWLLVALPLPLAVALQLGQAAFVAGVIAFAAGAALILGGEDDDGRRDDDRDETPPWWPAFERRFREYERDATTRGTPVRS